MMGRIVVVLVALVLGFFAGAQVMRFNMAQAFSTGEGAALCAELQRGQ